MFSHSSVFIGLGSNLKDRMANIAWALNMLGETEDIKITSLSSLYETEPQDFPGQPNFINCVARISTDLNPELLLANIKSIEKIMGRLPDSHLKPRPIDIDILLYDNTILNSPDLIIPHPRLTDRRFVLEPLLEIAQDITDPVTLSPLKYSLNKVLSQKVSKVPDSKEVADARQRQI